MANSVRSAPGSLGFVQRLAKRPWAHGFFQTLRRLEALHREHPRLGRSVRPAEDALRLAQEPSLEFAAANLAGWEQAADDDVPRLIVQFFGLFGPDGPLPLHLTEHARSRQRHHRDDTFRHFADIFHHRALSLFYRAWADSQPTVSFDRPEQDRFSTYVGALAGLGTEDMRSRDAMPDLAKLHFVGHLAGQTKHAAGLGDILSCFFGVPVQVECFVGAWMPLETIDRTRLGERVATGGLGSTASLGRRIWSRQHKFRLVFGPLELTDYERLLPGGSSFHTLIPVVRNYVGDTLAWDVNLVLRREAVPAVSLGRQGRLGWTSWLMPRPAHDDAADLFLDAGAESRARLVGLQSSHFSEVAA